MERLDEFAKAFALYEDFVARRGTGAALDAGEFLARHEPLRAILEPLLAEAVVDPSTELATESGPAPSSGWFGLPEEGQSFGSYRISRLLGQGGMGAVFLAEDRRLERRIALKLIRPERLASSIAKERFAREAKLVARLEHPGICPIYEVGEVEGLPFMAMRYVPGPTLAEAIAKRTAPPTREELTELLATIEVVARALHHAHEHGIVHRDVKPGNIILADDGPKLLDFGMARGDDSDAYGLTMTGDLAGTPLYMSPEQVAPKARGVDRTTDVFSLGVTLYEAVTGKRMFDGASMRELFDAILRKDPAPIRTTTREAPADLDVVIDKAVEKNRARRYRTAADFADDLARLQRNEPVHARRAGFTERVVRWTQRNPLVSAFLASAAVALVVITLLFVDGQRTRSQFDLVARAVQLRELRSTEPQLYESWPDHEPQLRAWIEAGRPFTASLPQLRATLEDLEQRGAAASETDRFLAKTLASLVSETEAFAAPQTGMLQRVERAWEWERTRGERERTPAHAAAWQQARAAIADHPRYDGLDLSPQVDLRPLGPDPESELWEFAHLRSGAPAVRQADGQLAIAPETGMVFVLLPGGAFVMGAQAREPAAANYDADALDEEGPVHEVTLAPFFVSKYPMTQSQWLRLRPGPNPSTYPAGTKARGSGALLASETHPVENVSWTEAAETVRWCGLTLPTEAQWEYACRADTDTPWSTGPTKDTLSGRANVNDKSASDMGAQWRNVDVSLEDGWALHAPVDSLAPNGFGLFHMPGNVWQWCSDWYDDYERPVRDGDGERQSRRREERVMRGGSYDFGTNDARSARRRLASPDARASNIGVRPARPIRR